MKMVLIALILLPHVVYAQATHRPATAEERELILDQGKEKTVQEIGFKLAKHAEMNAIEAGLMKEYLDRGLLPKEKIQSYIQHLTNIDLTKEEISKRINALGKEYFARLQVRSIEKVLPSERQKFYAQEMGKLEKELPKKAKELKKLTEQLQKEIDQNLQTLSNEKKTEDFLKSFHKEAAVKKYVKIHTPYDPKIHGTFKVMVPIDFNKDLKKENIPYCHADAGVPIDKQITQFADQVGAIVKEPTIKQIWISWGYNRAWHSNSDTIIETDRGEFTVHDAQFTDAQTPFGLEYFNPAKLTIPQFNFEIGVMFNDKWGMDLNFNHMKVKFDRLQPYELTGTQEGILAGGNGRIDFETAKANKDATWLRFEHSDGYNYISLGAIYNQSIFKTKDGKLAVDARFAGGAGIMMPRTDLRLYRDQEGNRYGVNNKFHVAGGGVHADARLKVTLWDSFFIQAATRGTYIKLKNGLANGVEGRIEHVQPIGSVQLIGSIGYQFNLNKKKKKIKKKD